MTVRQIWKSITRNYRVKKSIRKIKADHMKGQDVKAENAEFRRKYFIELRQVAKWRKQ